MAIKNLWIRNFDRDRDFVARRQMTIEGKTFRAGEDFDKTLVPTRRLRQMYDARKIMFKDNAETEVRMSSISSLVHKSPGPKTKKGYYQGAPIDPANAQNVTLAQLNDLLRDTVAVANSDDGEHSSPVKINRLSIGRDENGQPRLELTIAKPEGEPEEYEDLPDPLKEMEPEKTTETEETEKKTEKSEKETEEVEDEEVDESAPSIDELRAKAETLGIDVDGRWGQKRLQKEIAAKEQ